MFFLYLGVVVKNTIAMHPPFFLGPITSRMLEMKHISYIRRVLENAWHEQNWDGSTAIAVDT